MTDSGELETRFSANWAQGRENSTLGTTSAAEYRLTDETYAALLRRVSGKPVSNGLRQDILLSYYANLEKPYSTKKNPEEWEADQKIRRTKVNASV